MFLKLFSPFQLGLEHSFLLGPFFLQLLESPYFQFMKVILLPQNIECFLHFDDQFVFEFFEFLLEFPSLLLVLQSEVGPLLVGMLLHQFINPNFFLEFQFVELAPKVQSLIDSFFKGHELLLELQLLQPIRRLDLQVLIRVIQPLFECLSLIIRLLFEGLPSIQLGLLKVLILLIEMLAKLVNRVFSLFPVVLNLVEVDLGT